MKFDPDNEVVKLCALGMEFEGKGEKKKAAKLFQKAWKVSDTYFDKYISAHYVARHQKSVAEKLQWDKTALGFALKIDNKTIKGILPSLYLNIGKCYEDLKDFDTARTHYMLGKSYFDYLPTDGYGNMIKAGVEAGMERVSNTAD